jgi:hypothetical protein
MVLLELLACGGAGAGAGAGENWPTLSPCSKKTDLCHSLVLVIIFTDAFTVFPTVLFGIAVLIRALGAAGSGLAFYSMHIHISQ